MTHMYDLSKILPHKPPMILLDDIAEIDIENGKLVSIVTINPEKMFYEKNKGINSLFGIEFMAQTVGCYAFFKNQYDVPKAGLLLGSRLYNNKVLFFKDGETYKVSVHEVFTDNEIVVFDCIIFNSNGDEIASATINAYQNDNIVKILAEN